MSTQEVSISPYVFHTADAGDYPGVTAVSAKLIFPHPFTLGDYKRWFRALTPDISDPGNPDNDDFLREYRAAMTVSSLEEVMPEGDPPTPDPTNPHTFTLRDVVLMDGRAQDTLPIPFATWVCDCAQEAFGDQFVLEGRQTKLARLSRFRLTSTAISTQEPTLLAMLPDLASYPGSVTFAPYMTKTVYVKWQKALRPLPDVEATDIDNTSFMRQYRAALELVSDWNIEGWPLKVARHKDGEGFPLVLASWLVLAAEMYLSKSLPQKKMPALSGGM